MTINMARCLIAAFIVACSSLASGATWHVIDLGAGDFSVARGINSRGDITGSSSQRGFVRLARTGEFIDIGTLGGASVGFDINNRQWVVGWSQPLDEAAVAIVWKPESGIQIIGRLPGHSGVSSAYGINNRGQVVGMSCCDDRSAGFIWSEAKGMQDLGRLGSSNDPSFPDGVQAYDLNNRGIVVGASSTDAGPEHAFLWSRSLGMIDLGTLGGIYSVAVGINSKNQIVGSSETANRRTHAFLWFKGEMMDIGNLGGDHSAAEDINDRGEVVGISALASGVPSAFIWTAREGMVALPSLTENGESSAHAINDRGVIVGHSINANGWPTAVMWVRHRHTHTLDTQ